jgi:putative membrane protein insertion efficiency factor
MSLTPFRPGVVARALAWFFTAYKVALSPFLPPACRYTPTCSEYARDAVLLHGALRGSWLAARRLARCHPWGGHGHDPVPPSRLS